MEFRNQNRQNLYQPGIFTGQTIPNQNQNFGWPQQQQQNPYFEQMRQSTPVFSMNGRIVQNVNDVVPDEVKMDGSCSFFPVLDGSAIYVMRWSKDGSIIEKARYVPENIPQNNQEQKSFEQMVMERLDQIEASIRNQNKSFRNKRPYKNNKEGMNNDTVTQTGDESTDSK